MKLSISSYQAKPQSKHGDTFYSDWPENREPSQNIWPDCKTINALQARAFGHSEPAARKARLIAVAVQQWPKKTPLDRPREISFLTNDVQALAAMMREPARRQVLGTASPEDDKCGDKVSKPAAILLAGDGQ